MRSRIGRLILAATVAAASVSAHAQSPLLTLSSELSVAPTVAQTQTPTLSTTPAVTPTLPPLEGDLDTSYRPLDSSVGLRPTPRSRDNIALPFGMNYSRGSLTMSLDEKNESGIGLQLNMNRVPEVELAPSGLGLQPKRAPGIIYNKRF